MFRSVAEFETAIQAYIEASNADPKSFRWIKAADDILAGDHFGSEGDEALEKTHKSLKHWSE